MMAEGVGQAGWLFRCAAGWALASCLTLSARADNPDETFPDRIRRCAAEDSTCTVSNVHWRTVANGRRVLDVTYVLRPSADSFIVCCAAFPRSTEWNGRMWGYGKGGWAGLVESVAESAANGDMAVSTDMGTGPSCGFHTRVPDPWSDDVWKDFCWRSTHLMTVSAKRFARALYGRGPHHAYFIGSSTGGGQGLHEAQRFPEDYDGVVSELPAIARVSVEACAFLRSQIDNRFGLSGSRAKILADAAVRFMADKDEPYARGRFLTDPSACIGHEDEIFDLATKDDPAFAAPAFRAALLELYRGLVAGGRRAHPGYAWGAEFNHSGGLICFGNYLAKRDGAFDERKATWDDFAAFASARRDDMDAMNPDLSDFAARGGKIIMTAGLEDQTVSYLTAVDYYEDVVRTCGGLDRAQAFFRLFLLPGCAHGDIGRELRSCPPADLSRALVAWCERGQVPETVEPVGRGGVQLRVAAYPKKAVQNADGSWGMKDFTRGCPRIDPFFAGGRPSAAGR